MPSRSTSAPAGQQDGQLAHRAPGVRRPDAALQPGLPRGENIQAWLYEAESGGDGVRGAWRAIMEDNPFPAVMGRVCYHPCETVCNRAQLDEAVGINSVERFLGDEGIKAGRWSRSPALPASACSSSAPAPAWPPPITWPVSATRSRFATPPGCRRGNDALRHSEVPPPRDVLDAEIQRILDLGVTLELNAKVRTSSTPSARVVSTPSSSPSGHLGKRAYILAGPRARPRRGLAAPQHGGRGEAAAGPRVAVYGGGNTAIDAARTAKALGAAEAIIVYRRTRDRMPAHDFEVEEAEQEGVLMKWLSTIKGRTRGSWSSSGWSSTRRASRSRPASSRARGRLAVLALGQETDLSLLDGVPGLEVDDGVVQVGLDLMTGHSASSPRRHGARRANGDRRRRARQEGGAQHRRLAAPADHETAPKHELAEFAGLNTWYYRTRRER